MQLINDGEYEYGLEWGQQALQNHMPTDEIVVPKIDILETLAVAYNATGKLDEVRKLVDQILEIDLKNEVAKSLSEACNAGGEVAVAPKKVLHTREKVLHR